ncbi:hypothetical protein BT96DRAFT_837803 [Gymnopus androsaceus JB14]|uniref:DUF6830 domain-containing protein n=1 Tax=Gymnopus androsaceus JB14 TaxID=1447944 RepID=A0A6A4GPH3_9AGAR|nr:hypothetical protein BT96DRAFT_837803 [Gymnopus androsaceus JB14]
MTQTSCFKRKDLRCFWPAPPLPSSSPPPALQVPQDHHDSYDPESEDRYDPPEEDRPLVIPYPGATKVVGQGVTYLDDFNQDRFAEERKTNLYYPFASRAEWETVSFLLNSSLTMAEISDYLKLELTKRSNLSFRTATKLRERVDLLPPVPAWKFQVIPTSRRYPSKTPLILYFRDPLECLQDILKSPLIQDSLNFSPLGIFTSSAKLVRVYESWLSGTRANDMQRELPEGATLLGTILSSDKTTISVITGNRVAHPLLISLANIDSDLLSKASQHLFNLLALIPIPKFIEKRKSVRGILENRLYHECLDIVLHPLKIAALIGCMMDDPLGQRRVCYTPCARVSVSEDDLLRDYKESLKRRTNGVTKPFWADWPLAEPYQFLTPEPLHHWFKMFWDHDVKWCIQVLGPAELDFRFSILQKILGYRHFLEGISSLKQVTGRTHRDIMRFLVALISGAASKEFVCALRALSDFRYAGQAPRYTNITAARMQTALDKFHQYKGEILQLSTRVNPKGEPILNWEIPKLEFLQSVHASISASGPVMQWSADATEHAHITEVKEPACSGNNRDFEVQICRHLDRHCRIRRFDLMTAMKDANVNFRINARKEGDEGEVGNQLNLMDAEGISGDDLEGAPTVISSSAELMSLLNPVSQKLFGSFRPKRNFFLEAEALLRNPLAPLPHWTFTDDSPSAGIHLVRDPDLGSVLVNAAAEAFGIPDFRGALRDYLDSFERGVKSFTLGGRRFSNLDSELPFQKVKVWSRARIQAKTYYDLDLVNDTHTIFAHPPMELWKYGRYDCAIVNVNPEFQWPRSSLEGHCIYVVRLIFTVQQLRKPSPPIRGTHKFLAYCERLDAVDQPPPPPQYSHLPAYRAWPPHYPDYPSGYYVLRRATRANGSPLGGIIPLSQFRALANVIPHMVGPANPAFTQYSSFHYANQFLLNKAFNKETFYALDKGDPCLTS